MRSTNPTNPQPLLTVTALRKEFSTPPVLALDNIDLAIEAGQIVSIVGPSGCGKSTLLRIIAGLDRPTSGEVSWASGTSTAPAALMPQSDGLYPWERVVDNVALASRIKGEPRERGRSAAMALLTEFSLDEFARAWPSQLSGGMRSRVALLRTMLASTTLIGLDEPFGALDALTRVEMQQWLLAAAKRHRLTVLLITHDVDEAVTVSDRVLVLSPRPARVVADVPVQLADRADEQLRTHPDYLAATAAVREALYASHAG